ncbi:MAG: hypothetical protein IPH13_20285 [Planctomycetes bacterium]|nr:hypothetical protein [Planctomycetota bacterium]
MLTFSYRGIGFSRTSKGIWVFDQIPPTGGWWARYTTPTEARILDDPRRPVNEGLAIMHLAIDRLLAGKVVYTGDIRDKHLASDPTH